MINTKTFFITESIISIVLGIIIILNTKIPIIGAVIAKNELSLQSGVLWGAFFTFLGVALLVIELKR
ncbi:hypothetical protein J4463_00800 [Candidatus Pacearchaeota archaeon]|nr:hypothetical protein [Candidatus Pacearchaeota archaeon]